MITMGIDPSIVSTGIVTIKGDVVTSAIASFPFKENYEHLIDMRDFFDVLFDGMVWDDEVAIAIEGYSFASRGNTLTRLVELGTIIRLQAAIEPNIEYYIVAPQNLKKFVSGKTFKKDEMRLEVFKRWGFEDPSNDIVDAFALAKYANAIYKDLHHTPQGLASFQRQAIESWKKNKNGLWVNEA